MEIIEVDLSEELRIRLIETFLKEVVCPESYSVYVDSEEDYLAAAGEAILNEAMITAITAVIKENR